MSARPSLNTPPSHLRQFEFHHWLQFMDGREVFVDAVRRLRNGRMGRRKEGSRRAGRRDLSAQLNLFEAAAQPARMVAKPATPLRVRSKRVVAPPTAPPVILTPRQAAEYLNVAVSTLKSWRAKKIGPVWRKRGARLICYFPEDLDAFLRRGPLDHDKP